MKTPLILAVEGEHTKVVTMLVENKCDIDISDKDGRTALDIAEENRFHVALTKPFTSNV
jgi:ankyrin repeat protein